MSEELTSKIMSWLDKQGFPLEMEVASIAKKAGFGVVQSSSYLDPETNEVREIDLHLYSSRYSDAEYVGHLSYNIFIECKSSSGGKPWLLFCADRPPISEDEFKDILNAVDTGRTFVSNPYGAKLLSGSALMGDSELIYPKLRDTKWFGYGVTQAFSEAHDAPYKAMMSAAKSAIAYSKLRFPKGDEQLGTPFTSCLPLIVIDVPMYAVSYQSNSGEIKLEEIEQGHMHWKRQIIDRTTVGIFIVTKKALPEFLKKCYASAEWLLSKSDNELKEIRDEVINN